MRVNRYWIYPEVKNVGSVLVCVLLGATIGGIYGAVHDQLSYAISPEYFTLFKLEQFSNADFGLPHRAFASLIGFLSTWWAGGIAGWFIGRIRFNSDRLETAWRDVAKAFGIVLICVVVALCFGATLGYVRMYPLETGTFLGWEKDLTGSEFRRFAIVGHIHNTGYLGALLGLITSIVFVRKRATPATTTDHSLNG